MREGLLLLSRGGRPQGQSETPLRRRQAHKAAGRGSGSSPGDEAGPTRATVCAKTPQAGGHAQGTPPHPPGLAGCRNGLGETMSGPSCSGGELGQAGVSPSVLQPGEHPSAPPSHLFQPPGGVPGTQPLLPNSMDPTRQQGREGRGGPPGGGESEGLLLPPCLPLPLTTRPLSHAGHPNMGGSMQRMNPPRGMGPMGPGPQVITPVRPSVRPPDHLCAPAFSPSQSVSPPTALGLQGWEQRVWPGPRSSAPGSLAQRRARNSPSAGRGEGPQGGS